MSSGTVEDRRRTLSTDSPMILSPTSPATTRRGSLLLEAIIAIAIFAMTLMGIGFALLLGEHQTIAAGDRARAVYLAEQQLEILRQMHTPALSNTITPGPHGLVMNPAKTGWIFSGTSTVSGAYTTSVEVATLGTDWMDARARTSWSIDRTRFGSIEVDTYLTDWDRAKTIGNWASPHVKTLLTDSDTPAFRKIAVSGTYAFVTGSIADGGRKGLYVFDCSSNPPTEVATGFNLMASADGIAIAGNRLYVATDEPGRQVQVYNISSPATLNADNLVASYGGFTSGLKATAIGVYGTTVFVGTNDNAVDPQFYALKMNDAAPMTLLGSLRVDGNVNGMSLHDGYAYLATTSNATEVQVVDVFDPTNLVLAPRIGIDMPDVFDAYSIALSGSSALIGQQDGDTISELMLQDVSASPVPSPPPGPWTWERGGDVNDLTILPGTKYAFAAGTTAGAQLTILDLAAFARNQNPVLFTYSLLRSARGVTYDRTNDLLYFITDKDLFIFAPG